MSKGWHKWNLLRASSFYVPKNRLLHVLRVPAGDESAV